MREFFLLIITSSVACQQLPLSYNAQSIAAGVGICPSTQYLREGIDEDLHSLINSSVLPALRGYGACGCGGPGWRRAAYLNMSDPTQTCPPAWELITTPRRSCARPSSAGSRTCYSAMFPTQGIQYSQVCGRIIGYQIGHGGAFTLENNNQPAPIDGPYVDGVSLTYGNPRQHIWTFASALDEVQGSNREKKCPCNYRYPHTVKIPSFVSGDYFCETGVPPGHYSTPSVFYAADPLWDGGGCGPTSTCCTFNNPPWFCKQLPQSTNTDLEVRLCSIFEASRGNIAIKLIEIYIK